MLNPYDSHFSQLLEPRSAAEPQAAGACTREGGEHAHGTSFIRGSKALSEQGRTLRVVPIAKRNPFLVKIFYQELCPRTHPARAALGCMGLPCPGRSHLQTVCACVVLESMGLGSTAGSPVRPEAVVLLQCTRILTAALHPQVVLPNPGTTSETWPGGGKEMPCL